VIGGEDRRIIAVGSGKGGVGKSLMSANFGVALARRGRRVVLVDADLGGANLHTCLGMETPKVSLSSFITRKVESLESVVVPTGVPGLSLVSGASDLLDSANPHHAQKLRLLRHLVKLDFDDLLLDLGAGTSFNVLDFYLLAEHGILVISPEPTSEENAYRFLKAAYLRRLRNVQQVYGIKHVLEQAVASFRARGFISTPRELVETVRRIDADVGALVEDEMARFRPHLLVNQSRGEEDELMGQRIVHTCRHLLGVTLVYVGAVPYDDAVWQSVRRQRPLLLDNPGTRAARAINEIVTATLGGAAPVRDWSPAQRLFRRVSLGAVPGEAPSAEESTRSEAVADQPPAEEAPAPPAQRQSPAPIELATGESVGTPRPSAGATKRGTPPGITLPEEGELFDGGVLREVREARGWSLDEVAQRTKIPLAKLTAIEANDFSAFAARVYLRGFVYQFARCLGLDGQRLARAYMRQVDSPGD